VGAEEGGGGGAVWAASMAASGEAAQRIANERRFMDFTLAMDYGA
jgi:hypothetical protein